MLFTQGAPEWARPAFYRVTYSHFFCIFANSTIYCNRKTRQKATCVACGLEEKTLRKMPEKGVKKSVCLSGSKNQAPYNDKRSERVSKVPDSVQGASLRTLAFRSHFLVFSSQP